MPEKIILQNDGILDIATGKNRRETSWRNREMLWSELVTRVSETHRTAESHAEYLSAKKIRQDEIKDVGGFVGGHLTSGRRKAGNVSHRQLLTLDIDHGTSDIWDDFLLMYGNAAALYSTHKHNPDAPRFRLLIPLKTEVFTAQYEAIARRVAGTLGIENFDHTTFEPSRLMYWPSTSKDGVYRFEYNDSEWLDPEEILNSYHNWKDSSEWPLSDKYNTLIQRNITKQGDPLEKPGVIGAFCRTYNIHEAIDKFLSDVYDPCDIEGRYTYKHGSTAAGLITYDDKYAFSHHGTDPISGKLCNAFDLVRIHKYGLKDEDAAEGTKGNRLPSYTSMIEFASKDPNVRIQHGTEILKEAQDDFKDIDGEVDGDIEDITDTATWMAELDMDKKGNVHTTINNVVLILENDKYLKNKIAYDDFEKCEVALKDLPWRKINQQTRRLIDKDDANIRHYLEKVYSISSALKIRDAMEVISTKKTFHPVKDYLNSLVWDRNERVDTLFIDYQGAEDNKYIRAVTRKTLVAAIARIFRPGVKFDYVLTLVGKQGSKKSSIIGKLGRQWFSDSFSTIKGKESFEQLQGVWIVEIAELAGLAKGDVESVKHFISKREDRYRVAFGRRLENFPRQSIFFASTNRLDFLKDTTGGRRFWAVQVNDQDATKDVFKDLNDYEIDQIWAEALEIYKQGEELYLSPELEQQAAKVQQEHTEVDERAALIHKYIDTLLPADWDQKSIHDKHCFLAGDELAAEGSIVRDKVCAAEIWCEALGGFQKDMTTHNTRFIHDIMRNLKGWAQYKSKTNFKNYGVLKGYYRIESNVGMGMGHSAANENFN
jgi:putative DNA primase/helicase